MTIMATTAKTMTAYLDSAETPAGRFAFAVDGTGALVRASFVEGVYRSTLEEELAWDGWTLASNPALTAPARREIEEYARGERETFTIPVAPRGSAWQLAVWQALRAIPFGETRSYGELAASLGQPGAARAVGRANATNPIPLVIPCHRVIGANGTLTGFAGGIGLKQRLLAHERRCRGIETTAAVQQGLGL